MRAPETQEPATHLLPQAGTNTSIDLKWHKWHRTHHPPQGQRAAEQGCVRADHHAVGEHPPGRVELLLLLCVALWVFKCVCT